MKSTVEVLEDNKVKVSVEIDEEEFDKNVDAAFKRISREVRLPGFRPGKAPRRVLEARLGSEVGREEALRESVPDYYAEAVREHAVDVIAAPDFDITGGQEDGPVTFDAVVEVRPQITIDGYENLQVEIPSPLVTDEEIDEQVERLREQYRDFETADRPATDGDQVMIDITGTQDGEELEGLTATDYLFEIGSAAIPIPEISENLLGKKVGDIIEFDAAHPEDEEASLHFRILVKEVKGAVLPDLDDAWVQEATEFETVDEFVADLTDKLSRSKKATASAALRDKTAEALAGLVEIDLPEALVSSEVENRVQQFMLQLRSQGVEPQQWFEMTGQDPQAMIEQFREPAMLSARVDLALRALAQAESLTATDDDLAEQIDRMAAQFGGDPGEIREQFERAGTMPAIRSDVEKGKALDWLIGQVEIVDEDGQAIDRADLEIPDDDPADEAGDADQEGLETAEDTAADEPSADDPPAADPD